MKKQATFLAFLLGIIAVVSINATVERINAEPIYYNSFDEDVTDALREGMEKFKEEYKKLNLSNDNFYVILSECNDEKIIMISYLSCPNCDMTKLVERTNRFMKISNRLMLPVVFNIDLKNSSLFASADGNGTRITEKRSGYAVVLDFENKVIDTGFRDL